MKVNLKKEVIDAIFENSKQQHETVSKLYGSVIPRFEEVKKVNHFPSTNKKTSEYIFSKAIEFDKKYHPNILNGGLWFNNGFSGDNETLKDFEVFIDISKLIYN